MPVLRAERVIAVRHRPISALGARGWAFLLPIGGADVRLFGGKGEIPPACERDSAALRLRHLGAPPLPCGESESISCILSYLTIAIKVYCRSIQRGFSVYCRCADINAKSLNIWCSSLPGTIFSSPECTRLGHYSRGPINQGDKYCL